MYQALAMDQLHVDNELARVRLTTQSARPRPDKPARRRAWWPRPRRSALRLAFAGLGVFRASRRTCVDC